MAVLDVTDVSTGSSDDFVQRAPVAMHVDGSGGAVIVGVASDMDPCATCIGNAVVTTREWDGCGK